MAGEIDFDELDKAVSSLMGKVGGETVAEQKPKTLAISPTLKHDEKPTYDALGKVAEKIGSETLAGSDDKTTVEKLPDEQAPAPRPEPPQPAASTAVKRPNSGRFLDVMHPAGDMRSTTVPPRQAAPAPQPAAPSAPAAPAKPAAAPDLAPLPPVTSPFLPDAKVEKRPLGGEAPTGEPAMPDDTAEAIVETEVINNDQKHVDDGSGDEQRPLDANDFDVEAALQEQKLQSIESVIVADKQSESIQAIESGDTGKVTYEAVSSASEGTGNTAAGIYDVGTHGKPLAHPAKQKSGWGIVVIIAIIIALAIAAGAAAYFIFVKP